MEQNAVVEPAPDWMPTNEPEPAYAPPVVGFISSFQPVTGSPEPIAYPPDHRPAPLTRPVLVPAPPMHQGHTTKANPPFSHRSSIRTAHIFPVCGKNLKQKKKLKR